ncbi:hypothetical protein ALTER154_70342 [Alteromonas sp. 154]|nr:hypothetical protein ALTER154_70342 [Alteromonas sp. 154]
MCRIGLIQGYSRISRMITVIIMREIPVLIIIKAMS